MIYLLGGGGFVGSGFVRYLGTSSVTVIDRSNYADLAGSSCDVFINANGDSRKFVAHSDPKLNFQSNVASVRNSLVDFRFKKYVFLSSGDVYPDSSRPGLTDEAEPIDFRRQSAYGFHKYLAELCVQHAARDWLIIRQGGFVGPGMKKNAAFDVMFGQQLWVHPDSEFQFIHTDDSARLVMQLIGEGVSNEVFNLTGTGTISIRETMRLVDRFLPHAADAPCVHYELSTDKVSRFVHLPETMTSVQRFLERGVKQVPLHPPDVVPTPSK